MIVVRVELHSALTGERTELARMHISNTGGGTRTIGHYSGETLRGRSSASLDRAARQRSGFVRNWPRLRLHVWNLVATAEMERTMLDTSFKTSVPPPRERVVYVILHETIWHSIAKDASTLIMILVVIGAGAWLSSSAMQWCGFGMLCLAAFARASGRTKRLRPQAAADLLWEQHGVQRRGCDA